MTMKMTKAEIEAIAMNAKELVKKFADAEAKAKAACEAVEAMRPEVEKAVAFMIELGEKAETTEKKRPSKLWSITYTFHGKTKEFWSARDIYNALGGKTVKGFCEMVDGLRRGDCVQLRRDIIKVSGCPEYSGDSLSYWMDEIAVDEATAWMADKERQTGKRSKVNKDYDETAVVSRYNEVHSATVCAEEFNVSIWTVYDALERNGIKPCGKTGRKAKITPEMEREIIRLYTEEGLSQTKIAKIMGVSTWPVCVVLRRNGIGRGLDR